MPHILKNQDLEIHIDLPLEGYNFSRFDWTGKITLIKFQNTPVTTIERTDTVDVHHFGKGLYNEFGIDTALGFKEAALGEWFHKIGVGTLKKKDESYLFSTPYEIRPALFEIESGSKKLLIQCKSENLNGYSYVLKKEIVLHNNNLVLNYQLGNTGEKTISTDEYVHNFMVINQDPVGKHYSLEFPFEIQPAGFGAAVNPEKKVEISKKEIRFAGTPEEQFFFSNLNGNKMVQARWELQNWRNNIGISETGSFQTRKINLWGWGHVISPELFQHIVVKPGESTEWTRTYRFQILESSDR